MDHASVFARRRKTNVRTYDFVTDCTHDGKAFRMLVVIDEYTRECPAIHVRRKLDSRDVLHCPGQAVCPARCTRAHSFRQWRSGNGPEFVATAVRDWLAGLNVKTLYIEPGSPWENGYCESFDGKPRDECLNREIFTTLTQAQILIELWRRFYNTERPHSSPGSRPPAPETYCRGGRQSHTLQL